MRSFAFRLVWVVVFTIPFDAMFSFGGFGTLTRFLGYSSLLVGIVAIARGGMRPLGLPHLLTGAYLVWATSTIFWSVDPDAGLFGAMTVLRLVGVAWLIWEYAGARPQRIALLQAYVLGCGVSAIGVLIAAWRGAGLALPGAEVRFTAAGMNMNELAAILGLGVVMAFYLASEFRARLVVRVLYFLYAGAGIVAIPLTGSRGGLMTGIVGLVFIVIFNTALGTRARLVFALAVVASAVLAFGIIPDSTEARLAGTGRELRSGTWGSRLEILGPGVEVFWQRPVVGVGLGGFRSAVARYYGYPIDAHNTYLNVLAETGIVGFLLFFSVLVVLLKRQRSLPRRDKFLWVALTVMWSFMGLSGSLDRVKTTWFLYSLGIAWSMQAGKIGPPTAAKGTVLKMATQRLLP